MRRAADAERSSPDDEVCLTSVARAVMASTAAEAAHVVSCALVERVGFHRAVVLRYEASERRLSHLAACGPLSEELSGLAGPIEAWPSLRRVLDLDGPVYLFTDERGELVPVDDQPEASGATLIMALRGGEQVYGFLGADTGGAPLRLDERQTRVVRALGACLAAVLAREALQRELRRREELERERQQSLARLQTDVPIEVLARLAAREAGTLLGAHRCLVTVDAGDEGPVVGTWTAPGLARRVERPSALAEWCRRRHDLVAVDDLSEQEPAADGEGNDLEELLADGVRAALAAPIAAKGQTLGAVEVHHLGRPRSWMASERDTLRWLAAEVGLLVYDAGLQRTLRQDRSELLTVMAALPEGVYTVDAEGRVRTANPRAADLVGEPVLRIVGRPCREVLPLVDEAGRPLCDWACPRARGHLGPVHGVVRAFLDQPGGRRRVMLWSCASLPEADGRSAGWVEVVRDVSHLHEVEEMRATLLSAVSHELLTPVAIIKGHAESLRDPEARRNDQLAERALEAIDEEAERLKRLVANLLDAARAGAGAFTLSRAPLALGPLVQRVVARFQGRSRRHRFEVDLPSQMPLVVADRERVESVLYNLLDNAVKYSPRGGTVRVSAVVHEGEVEVRVTDEGIGIPWAERERVFERFYRGGGAQGRAEGAGLGLYIVKTIVDAHGGRIWVESRPGRGTTVVFTLPREAPPSLPALGRGVEASAASGA
ncbi:MAG TPA: ATP-binding protein [Chloroflexota bacterium]